MNMGFMAGSLKGVTYKGVHLRTYSRFAAFKFIFFALVCGGCAAERIGPGYGMGKLSPAARRLEVVFEAQAAPDLCGLASLKMLTGYYGKPLSAVQLEFLRDEAKATNGISGESLKMVLEGAGYFVAVYEGTLDREASGIFRQIDLGRPLIVMTGAQPRHLSVVTGYDGAGGRVILLDPAVGAIAPPFGEFLKDWDQANRFTLLAVPEASGSIRKTN
jgi:ABC-type bacteriocin/lantibiotic exporter with double-glycine peptidase domain